MYDNRGPQGSGFMTGLREGNATIHAFGESRRATVSRAELLDGMYQVDEVFGHDTGGFRYLILSASQVTLDYSAVV